MKKNYLLFLSILFISYFTHAQEKAINKEINPDEINAFLNNKGKSLLSASKNKSFEEFRLNFSGLKTYVNYLEALGMPREQLEEDLGRTNKMLEFPIRKVFEELTAQIDSMPEESKVDMCFSWSFQYLDGTPRIEPISYLFEFGEKGILVQKIETNNLSTLLIKKKAISILQNSNEINSIKAEFIKTKQESERILEKWKASKQ